MCAAPAPTLTHPPVTGHTTAALAHVPCQRHPGDGGGGEGQRPRERGGGSSYLWGHTANGGNVIARADEVWSVDLQLKFAQPLDNSL